MNSKIPTKERIVVYNDLVRKLINDGFDADQARRNAKELKKWRFNYGR